MTPLQKSILILGPPLIGKNELLLRYEETAAKENVPLIIITTDATPESVRSNIISRSKPIKDFDEQGKIRYIDCYTEEVSLTQSKNVVWVPGTVALTELCIALKDQETQAIGKYGNHLIVFNSLSSILLYAKVTAVARFVQVLVAKVKESGGSIIFTLEEGMHDEQLVVTIQHLVDETVKVKREGNTLYYFSTEDRRWNAISEE